MTSGFFMGTDTVRGYAGDSRSTFRVANDNAFGLGPETIYIGFDGNDFSSFTGPVASAILTVQSVSGGFGFDAGPGSPFTVSAHGVDADPFSTIIDDTNPTGTTSWIDYFNNHILTADPAAITSVDSFGTVTFDVTALVNDWVSGSNNVFALALTGTNDTSGTDFLHGFLNNTEAPGSTFLTVNPVPEPATFAMLASLAIPFAYRRVRRRPRAVA
ncbi:hypothetical protein U8335_23450 [Roseiconus lacunae]|uniref:hypothetical protein n=1 Tax=Roseiconus lacunae TaxID=2605694 RepID=UPI00308D9BAB|nr:hypothetical protein U8335_23450 [Stieleria sp. HD01]